MVPLSSSSCWDTVSPPTSLLSVSDHQPPPSPLHTLPFSKQSLWPRLKTPHRRTDCGGNRAAADRRQRSTAGCGRIESTAHRLRASQHDPKVRYSCYMFWKENKLLNNHHSVQAFPLRPGPFFFCSRWLVIRVVSFRGAGGEEPAGTFWDNASINSSTKKIQTCK